jgi:predicted membrane protein
MDPFQIFIRANGVPLIDALVRATIPNEMLGASKYAFPANNKGAVLQINRFQAYGKHVHEASPMDWTLEYLAEARNG